MKAAFDCHTCRLREFECFRRLAREELAAISDFRQGELRVDAGADILKQGANSAHFYTLYEGWTARRITLTDGRSQITNFALPGALLGLQAALEQEMDHSVEALTDVVLCVFPRSEFRQFLEKNGELCYRTIWQAAREEHFLGGNITAIGRKSAEEKIAYLFASLYDRAIRSGVVERGRSLEAPITQQHVADAMGLSIAHTHRVLRQFASDKLIEPNRRKITILDPDELADIGHFDSEAAMPMALL